MSAHVLMNLLKGNNGSYKSDAGKTVFQVGLLSKVLVLFQWDYCLRVWCQSLSATILLQAMKPLVRLS